MEATIRPPRHFTYLDHEVAGSYLSHFVGGLPEGGSYTDARGDNAGLGAKFGVSGFGVSGRYGNDFSAEDTESYRHTPASLFERLYQQLDEHGMITRPQALDEESWANINKGDFVEITGIVRVPEVVKVLGVARGLDQLLPFMEQLGAVGELEISEEDRAMMGLMRTFGQLGNSPESPNAGVVVAELPTTPDYSFVATLKRKSLQVNLEDLEGEATILAKTQRKIGQGDPPIGIEQLIPGLESLKGLQDFASPQMEQADDEDFSIGYPAASIIPVGIYL